MKDATSELNKIMNAFIDSTVKTLNEDHDSCDEGLFRETLHSDIGGRFWTGFENAITDNAKIDRRHTDRKNSVYRDCGITETPALYMVSLGALYRLGDLFIGSDKFGHFLEIGYHYFDLVYGDGGSLEKALAEGEFGENTYFGLQTTGIYSYGDLASNYDGLLFWERLIGNKNQIPAPMVTCKNGKYTKNRAFNWVEFISPAWDEAMNCNKYESEEMEKKIMSRIRELEEINGTRMQCPIAPTRCREMIEKYGNIAPRVISPKCFAEIH